MDVLNNSIKLAPQILVVEDNEMVRDVIENLLRDERYFVLTSDNGVSALTELEENDVDLIVCDVMMPEMDGYQLQKTLNGSKKHAKIPFVFLTALASDSDKQKGVESGADAYLTKPFSPEELISVIKGKLARAENLDSYYLEQQERFSSQVIKQISHEFRTPLVAISTGSEFLLKEQESLSKDKLSMLLNTIWRGGQRIQKLVNNFVVLQRIQSGLAEKNFQKNAQEFDLLAFLNEYVEKKRFDFAETDFKFSFTSTAEQRVKVNLSRKQLEIILDSLVDNAMKFSPDDRRVDIAMEERGERVAIDIRDHGNGFHAKDMVRLTTTFHQEDRHVHEQQGGGLGLTIVKALTKINDGRIKMSNARDGGGVVRLLFPVVD